MGFLNYKLRIGFIRCCGRVKGIGIGIGIGLSDLVSGDGIFASSREREKRLKMLLIRCDEYRVGG